MTYWRITDKGDPDMIALVDGKIDGVIHYSRQTPGARLATRNGQNLVLIAHGNADNGTRRPVATWISFRPTPGKATRADKRDAVECALFKLIPGHGLRKPSGGKARSSLLISEAVHLTRVLWGDYRDGLITFIRPEVTTAQRDDAHPAGWSYRRAGWVEDRPSSDGKLCLRAPELPVAAGDLFRWSWEGARGGKLRDTLENAGVFLGHGAPTDPTAVIRSIRMREPCEICDASGPSGPCAVCTWIKP